MAKLSIFNFISLDGYYKGLKDDIGWAKARQGEEENQYSIDNLKGASTLVFGRVTYDMMASFWTSKEAAQHMPQVAEGMNKADKIVLSRTLKKADWNNTKVVSGDIVKEMKKLKKSASKDMTILGSGTIVTLFAEHNLIDTYGIMIHPIAIGKGTPIFKGIAQNLKLKLTESRAFKSGSVLLTYQAL